jgi:hypothetical protein
MCERERGGDGKVENCGAAAVAMALPTRLFVVFWKRWKIILIMKCMCTSHNVTTVIVYRKSDFIFFLRNSFVDENSVKGSDMWCLSLSSKLLHTFCHVLMYVPIEKNTEGKESRFANNLLHCQSFTIPLEWQCPLRNLLPVSTPQSQDCHRRGCLLLLLLLRR